VHKDKTPIIELSPGERWYVVHTRAKYEATAETNLLFQGFQTFLPRVKKTRRHARQVDVVKVPLFPRYLFVALDLSRDRWRSINGTLGVTTLLMERERPLAVPIGVLETLMTIFADGGEALSQPTADLIVGQAIEFQAGPFAQQIGHLSQLDASGRIKVLMMIMGRQIMVESVVRHVKSI
jgi:transcriptional antiterminator RfaH